jgi:hypothetical protein
MPDLDKPSGVAWTTSSHWVDVTEDDQPHGRVPPTKIYECFLTFNVQAQWNVGELSLAMVHANPGSQPLFFALPTTGDFNKMRDLGGGLSGTFKVARTKYLEFTHGGTVGLSLEIVTQTSAGQSELTHSDPVHHTGVLNRTLGKWKFSENVIIPSPPAP